MDNDIFNAGRMDCERCEAHPANSSEHYHRHFSKSKNWRSCANCNRFFNTGMIHFKAFRVPAPAPIHPRRQNGRGRPRRSN